jgi:hypothetical protein
MHYSRTPDTRSMRQNRPLSEHERAILERLLSVDFREVEYFRRQIPAITVTGTCDCGCGSIDFSVGAEARRAPSKRCNGPSHLLLEGDAENWLILFQGDGLLTELEHVVEGGPDLSVIDPKTLESDCNID